MQAHCQSELDALPIASGTLPAGLATSRIYARASSVQGLILLRRLGLVAIEHVYEFAAASLADTISWFTSAAEDSKKTSASGRQPRAQLLEAESLCCKACGGTALRIDQIWRNINGELNRVSLYHCDRHSPTFLDIPSYFFNGVFRQAPHVNFEGFEALRPENFGFIRRNAPGFWRPPPGHWMSSDKEVRALPFLVCRDCHSCNDYKRVEPVRQGTVGLDRLCLTKLFVEENHSYGADIVKQEQFWKSVKHHS